MQPEDVFTALNELGFDKYEETLREFIKNYNADKEDIAKKPVVGKKRMLVPEFEEESHPMDNEPLNAKKIIKTE